MAVTFPQDTTLKTPTALGQPMTSPNLASPFANTPTSPTNPFATPTSITTPTLPNIPAPNIPPPKTVAVVTPAPAAKDLATKQATTNAVAAATQAQTQNNLTKAINPAQLTGTASAGATPTTGMGTPQTPQQISQAQQPTPAPTNPNASTTTDILNLLNSGDVKLTQAQLQQIGGLNLAGVNQNPDGTYSVSSGAKAQLDTQNNYNPLASTGDPTTDYINGQLAQNQATLDRASTTYQNAVSQLLNGTFPLTADQQAQVAGLQAQFDQLRQAQQTANANFTGATTTLGIRSGREQYAPELAAGEIQNSITIGLQKVAQIDTQAAAAVASLKQGFLNNDYTLINDSYTKLQDAVTAKDNALAAMQKTITDQVAAQTQKINNQTAQLNLQTAKLSTIAATSLQAALKLDGTIDLNALQDIATKQGVDVNALYAAVLKEQQTEKLQQQQDAKFASDQLQAAAQLASTKATTAKTRLETQNLATPGALPAEVVKQNALDLQTVDSNYQTLVAIAKSVGKTPATMTEADVSKLSNADQVTVGKALARMQVPDVARQGGNPGSALEAVGIPAQFGEALHQTFTGQLYEPSKVVDAFKTAESIYTTRNTPTSEAGGAPGGFAPRGSTSANDFVANTFATLYPGQTESQVIAQYTPLLKSGEQLALDNNTGDIVAATASDISSGDFTPL